MISFCNFANFAFKEFVLKIIVMYIALGPGHATKPYTLHYTEKGSHPPPLETIIINLDFFLSQPQVSRPVSVARLGSFTVNRTQPKSDTSVFSPCL